MDRARADEAPRASTTRRRPSAWHALRQGGGPALQIDNLGDAAFTRPIPPTLQQCGLQPVRSAAVANWATRLADLTGRRGGDLALADQFVELAPQLLKLRLRVVSMPSSTARTTSSALCSKSSASGVHGAVLLARPDRLGQLGSAASRLGGDCLLWVACVDELVVVRIDGAAVAGPTCPSTPWEPLPRNSSPTASSTTIPTATTSGQRNRTG